MSKIISLKAREILDSRGNPTVEVDCLLETGVLGRLSVPSGASTGVHEALELRDKDAKRYGGKGVLKAVNNVNTSIAKAVVGMESSEQRTIDKTLIELDGTPNKSKLGANACVGVSLVVALASAEELGLPLYRWLGGAGANILPVPMLNVINGGVHADSNLDIQEFMIVPAGAPNFKEAIRMAAEIFQTLKKLLHKEKYATSVGDEGGFAPCLKSNKEACEFIVKAINESGYKPGKDVYLALDCAASNFYNDGKYVIEGKKFSGNDVIKFYEEWIGKFPIASIEDGFAEDDWDSWIKFTEKLGRKILIIGDDLYVTNIKRLEQGISKGASNAILIKTNQIGTLSETLNTIELAKHVGYKSIISHRSGETASTFISHLVVGTGVGLIKSGSACRSERIEKWNELIRIEDELGESGRYMGLGMFKYKNHTVWLD